MKLKENWVQNNLVITCYESNMHAISWKILLFCVIFLLLSTNMRMSNKNLRHVLVNMELIKREFIVIHDIEKRANHSIPRTQYAVVIKHPRNLSFRARNFPTVSKGKKNLLKNKIILKTTHKKVFSFFLAFFLCETVAPAFELQFLIR